MMKKLALLLALILSLTVFTPLLASAEEEPIELTYVDRYGAHNWDKFTFADMKKLVTDHVNAEFLPDFLK